MKKGDIHLRFHSSCESETFSKVSNTRSDVNMSTDEVKDDVSSMKLKSKHN